jgi:hypothetical protein
LYTLPLGYLTSVSRRAVLPICTQPHFVRAPPKLAVCVVALRCSKVQSRDGCVEYPMLRCLACRDPETPRSRPLCCTIVQMKLKTCVCYLLHPRAGVTIRSCDAGVGELLRVTQAWECCVSCSLGGLPERMLSARAPGCHSRSRTAWHTWSSKVLVGRNFGS